MTHIILIGCGKTKRPGPAAARDLYIGPLFCAARCYAEASGLPWFILSAEHGLVAPDQVIEPYDFTLNSAPHDYKQRWASRVLRSLNRHLQAEGYQGQVTLKIHAGANYVDPLRSRRDHFAISTRVKHKLSYAIEAPLKGLTLGKRLQWYKQRRSSTRQLTIWENP
jgi:hypothetical protein